MEFELALKISAFAILCAVAVIDIKLKRIPNLLAILLFLLGFVRMFVQKDFTSGLIGIFFPSIVLFLLRLRGSQYIGFGDIKLVMAVGFFYGYIVAGIIVLISLIMLLVYALIRRKRINRIESVCFGPFIAVASLIGFFLSH